MVTSDLNVNTVFMKIKFKEYTENGFLFGAADDANDNDSWYDFGEGEHQGELLLYSANSNGSWNSSLIIKDYFLYDNCEHTYAVTIDSNGVVTTYRDGILFGTYDYSPIEYTGDNAGKIRTGIRYDETDGGWDYPNMYLRRCRVFKSVLTEKQIKQLHIESLDYVEQPHIKTTLMELNNDETQILVPYQYNFEGQHLYKEIANEESLAISFDFLATQKRQYSLALVNMTDSNNPKSYVTKFEHNSDVMERITVIIPTKDIGYVKNNEELGCRLYIAGYNTNMTTDTEGLQDGEYITLSNSVTPAKGDSIMITNVQVEAGEIASDYIVPNYDNELQRCLRYYILIGPLIHQILGRFDNDDGPAYDVLHFIPMRCTPIVNISGSFNSTGGYSGTPIILPINNKSIRIQSNANTSASGILYLTSSTSDPGKILLEAEL
jgi:hypothetical protein